MDHATKDAPAHGADAHGHGGGGYHAHVVPWQFLTAIIGALMVLTVVTVAVAYVNLGEPANIILAMAIATVKASLVAAFFMHLRWDKPFNSVIFISTILFLALFLGFCILDAKEYQKDVIQDYKSAELPQFESDKSE